MVYSLSDGQLERESKKEFSVTIALEGFHGVVGLGSSKSESSLSECLAEAICMAMKDIVTVIKSLKAPREELFGSWQDKTIRISRFEKQAQEIPQRAISGFGLEGGRFSTSGARLVSFDRNVDIVVIGIKPGTSKTEVSRNPVRI